MRKRYVRKEVYDSLPNGKRKRLFHRTRELDKSILAQIRWEMEEIKNEIPKTWEGAVTFDAPCGEPFMRMRNEKTYVRRLRTSELYNLGIAIWPEQTWHDARGSIRQAILDAMEKQAGLLMKFREVLRQQWEGVLQ